jgi:uncharacterized protein (DUF488 family)
MSNEVNNQIHTIGHSNRSLEDLIRVLKHYGVQVLADVRRFPTSRHNPQFKKDILESKLPESGIEYLWIENLGGFRKGGYVEYTETKEFKGELEKLIEIAKQKRTAVMCAELLWFKCHRNFIATALTRQGWEVIHIYDEKKSEKHKFVDSLF